MIDFILLVIVFLIIFIVHESGHYFAFLLMGFTPYFKFHWWGVSVHSREKIKYQSFEDWYFIRSAGLSFSMPLTVLLYVIYPLDFATYCVLYWFGISIIDIIAQITAVFYKLKYPFFYFTDKTKFNYSVGVNQHG